MKKYKNEKTRSLSDRWTSIKIQHTQQIIRTRSQKMTF